VPIRPTSTIVPSEAADGTLKMDAQLSKAADNGIAALTAGVAAPGLFGVQARPAIEGQVWLSPIVQTINGWGVGSTTAPFNQIPISSTLLDDDGLDGSTPEVINAQSSTFGPITIAGYYAISASVQTKSLNGNGTFLNGNGQIAARSITPVQGVGVYRQIGGYTQNNTGGIEPMPVQTYGKWPFLYWSHYKCATIFPLGRGSFVEIGVRQSVNNPPTPSPGADACSAATPHVHAWIVLIRAFSP
jgi:hypothetical protein